MTPMAKIDSRDSAPPENRFTIPRIVLDRSAKKRATSAGFTPGTGMKVPMRYTTSAPMRNRTRLRISPKRAASLKAVAGLVRLVVAMALFQASILPPAASIAARAPLVAATPFRVTARVSAPDSTTLARSLPLGAAAAGLALARGGTAAYAPGGAPGAGSGLQCVQSHGFQAPFSTRSRWVAAAIMPRFAGVSDTDTLW